MNRERYEATVRFFSDNRIANRLLWFIYKVLPNVIFISYPVLLTAESFVMGATL